MSTRFKFFAKRFIPWLLLFFAAACLRPAEHRAKYDLSVGKAEGRGIYIDVENGLAAVRALSDGYLELWAQAPIVRIHISTKSDAATTWNITMRNCMPGSGCTAKTSIGVISVTPIASGSPTVSSWNMVFPLNEEINVEIMPPDAGAGPFKFALLSDIQGTDDRDMFAMMNADPSIRFVVSAGDITEGGSSSEINKFQDTLGSLNVPFYATVGNHDTGSGPGPWHDLIGRFNVHFFFKGVFFTLLDSGNATVDPDVYGWLDWWLAEAVNSTHVFVTHYPPFDPFGLRGGSFRSNAEAAKLLAKLARGYVDITLYGHIHSYYAYVNAGIPAYIAGGGGGIQGIIDPFGRHFLVIEAAPDGIHSVSLVRAD